MKLLRKTVSVIMLFLLLASTLTLAFKIQPVKAESGTIIVPDNYSTIQGAINAASPSDTIIVRDGTYTENIFVYKDHLTIKSENGAEKTIVQAANPNDHVFEVWGHYVNISQFTVQGATGANKVGILVTENHCDISNNILLNNYFGIYLSVSSHNMLSNNVVLNNRFGIWLGRSSYSTLASNTLSDNDYNFGVTGALLSDFTQEIDTSNTVNGKPIQYLINRQDLTIDSSWDVGFLGLVNCTNMTVKDLVLANNGEAMLLAYSTNSTIKNVNAMNNFHGVVLYYSHNNTITGISVKSSYTYGVALVGCSNNIIYLNSFIDNADSVYSEASSNFWNSPEKITYTYNGKTYTNYLGNYWSDYTGSDIDGDGIGDAPYSIDGDKDNYPLMEPFENYFQPAPVPEEWPFAIITDLHIGFGYPDYGPEGFNEYERMDDSAILRLSQDYYLTDRLTNIVESINNNPQIKFVVVLGDISDTAEYSEFLKAREILNMLRVPYIPVIGNHDVWPYTEEADQEKELHPTELITAHLTGIPLDHFDPDIRAEKEKRADSAVGDIYFNEIFWEQNSENAQKIRELFGDSFRRQYTGPHILRDTGLVQVLQNYVFIFNGIKFIVLDCNAREIDASGAQLFTETRDWLMENLKENEPTIIFSHHPTMFATFPFLGTQSFSSPDMDSLRQIIEESKAKVLVSFGGHTHGNHILGPEYEFKPEVDLKYEIPEIGLKIELKSGIQFVKNELNNDVVITEAVCRESIRWVKGFAEFLPELPLRTETRNCIRIVTILGNIVSYSRLESVTEDPNLRPTSYFTYYPKETSFKRFCAWPYDPNGDPTYCAYAWSFGDGQTASSERKPLHHYAKAGEYTVTLTVTDGGGAGSRPFSRVVTVRSMLEIIGWSPVDLTVTDPNGLTISKQLNEIPGAAYIEVDLDEDGDLDDIVLIPDPLDGNYVVLLTGTATGTYSVTTEFVALQETITQIYSGEIVEGAVYVYSVTLSDGVMTTNPDPIAELRHLKEFIDLLPPENFKHPKLARYLKKALSNKIDEVILKAEAGDYTDAINKLLYDIRAKMDGDSTAEDWIIDPMSQFRLCVILDHIVSNLEMLREQTG